MCSIGHPRLTSLTCPSRTIQASSAITSVFGGFSGFTATGSTAAAAPKPAAPASIFAFLSQDTKKDDGPAAKTDTTPTPVQDKDQDKEYHQKLRALNQSLCQWIKQHVDKDPVCILTPIFKDYEKHLQSIQIKSTTNGTSGSATGTIPVPAATEIKSTTTFQGFSFGGGGASLTPPSSIKATESSTSTLSNFSTAPKISFGANASSGSLFGKSSSEAAGTPPLVPSASTGFSFGGAKPFSFGSTGPSSLATTPAPAATETNNEDDEDEPPKVEFKAVVEEDSVYSKRCKVFFKVAGNFQERGIGTIFVKPVKDSAKHQLIVRADTSLGNILVNVVLAKGLPVQKMGANNVMLVCIPNADFDKPVSVLLKVKTAADADEVIENLKEHTPDE